MVNSQQAEQNAVAISDKFTAVADRYDTQAAASQARLIELRSELVAGRRSLTGAQRARLLQEIRTQERRVRSARKSAGAAREKAKYRASKFRARARYLDLRERGYSAGEASRKVRGVRKPKPQPITEVTEVGTGNTFVGQEDTLNGQGVFIGVRSVPASESKFTGGDFSRAQVTTTTRSSRRERDTPVNIPSMVLGMATIDTTRQGPTGPVPASFTTDQTRAGSPFDPEPGRPLYTSAVGVSTNFGAAEVFTRDREAPGASSKGDIPTFMEQRQIDINRLRRAYQGDDGREKALATVAPVFTQTGRLLEIGGQQIAQSERYTTTPLNPTGRFLYGGGQYMRTDPRGATVDTFVGLTVGRGLGMFAGSATKAVASGKAGQFASKYLGRVPVVNRFTSRLATSPGVQSVGQAMTFQRATTVVGGGIAAGTVVRSGYVFGAEAAGRIIPGFAGAGVGFSSGFRAGSGGAPRISFGNAKPKGEPNTLFTNNLMQVRATGSGRATLKAYGQTVRPTFQTESTFTGARLEGIPVYRGVGRVRTTMRVGSREFVSSDTFPGVFDAKSGTFSGRVRGNVPFPRFGSTLGEPQSKAPSMIKGGEIRSYSVDTFQYSDGGTIGFRGRGALITESFTSPKRRLGARPGQDYVTASGEVLQVTPRLVTVAQQRVIMGRSSVQGVSTGLGRGSRGRLARITALESRSTGQTPGPNVRATFEPQTQFNAALGLPGLNRAGNIQLFRVKPPRTRPRARTRGKGQRLGPGDLVQMQRPNIITRVSPVSAFGTTSRSATASGSLFLFSQPQALNRIPATDSTEDLFTRQGETPGLITRTTPGFDLTSTPTTRTIIGGGTGLPPPGPGDPPPPIFPGGGGFPLAFGLPPSGGAPPIGGAGRGFGFRADLISSSLGITGPTPSGPLTGLEARPLPRRRKKAKRKRRKR